MRGYYGIGLVNPKSTMNVGAILRSASLLGANFVAIQGPRFERSCADTMKAWKHMPIFIVDDIFKAIPYACVPIAIDLVPSARPLSNYVHPERAFYIFGAEDGILGAKVLDRCRDTLYIPTPRCLNLSVTASIIAYDRVTKRNDWGTLTTNQDGATIGAIA